MESSNIMIQRKRLVKLAEELKDWQILYVQAPAGYGKTVFAGQWLEGREGEKASVTLDEYDNTTADICCKLKNVLEDICPAEAEPLVFAYTKHPGFTTAPAEFLMRAAAAIPREIKAGIVIDDLHYLRETHAQKALKDFIGRLPDGIKICMLSRGELPDLFSELVLKNKVQFISRELLLFDSSEIYALYKSRNFIITGRQAEEILTFTEGWPIGINALLLSDNQIPTENVSLDWLESFLKTQVWEMWDERSREFMIAICMEDELSEGLCNALSGRNDSGRMLEWLALKGAFLSRQGEGIYRFHRLYREFLRKLFLEKPQDYREDQIRTAGKWYLERKDFYHAIERFSLIKDYTYIARCFDLLEDMDRAGFNTEQIMRAVHSTFDAGVLDCYPHLYFMMAFTARNEGRIEEFKEYADQYYRNYPQIVQYNPKLAHNIFFLYAMDFRYTLRDISQMAAVVPPSVEFQGVRGSATSYFPLYHRSFRDFSELLPGDIDTVVEELAKILGPLLGEECTMLRACICGGLYYEQGNLQRAMELALEAAAELKSHFAPESKFCVMVLLLTITHAMKQPGQEDILSSDIQKMIEQDKAFYLQFNFDAVICRNLLDAGDTNAAQEWLRERGSEVYGQLDLFKLYGHFATARANMVLGNYNQSIILLEKIHGLCKALNRTADVIEAEVLLAASYWSVKGNSRKKALNYLEEAVFVAQQLGYVQVFTNYGAEIKNMLSSLKNWTVRSDYNGRLSGTFVKKLYIEAVEQAKSFSGVQGEEEQNIKFTRQQKRVAQLMCEGYSYRNIAKELGVQFSTVRSHIELIYRKLDVSSLDEAILKIRRLHLLEK